MNGSENQQLAHEKQSNAIRRSKDSLMPIKFLISRLNCLSYWSKRIGDARLESRNEFSTIPKEESDTELIDPVLETFAGRKVP